MHKRKSVALKTETKSAVASKTQAAVTVDYPKPNEKLLPGHYAIRVSAGEGAPGVLVSVDGGEFLHCRSAEGFWYFDWNATPGRHSVVARRADASAETRARRFEVVTNGGHSN